MRKKRTAGPRPRPAGDGFTLVELLAVIAIIAIISAFAVPAVKGMLEGNHVTRGQQTLEQTLTIARQTAVSQNRRVEVRLYKYDDPDLVGSEKYYRGIRLFLRGEDTAAKDPWKPLGKLVKLPGNLVINENSEASPLLESDDAPATEKLPGIEKIEKMSVFQFRPDGSMTRPDGSKTLAASENFLSAHSARSTKEAEAKTLPPDFVVVQIDPASGSIRSYRP